MSRKLFVAVVVVVVVFVTFSYLSTTSVVSTSPSFDPSDVSRRFVVLTKIQDLSTVQDLSRILPPLVSLRPRGVRVTSVDLRIDVL